MEGLNPVFQVFLLQMLFSTSFRLADTFQVPSDLQILYIYIVESCLTPSGWDGLAAGSATITPYP